MTKADKAQELLSNVATLAQSPAGEAIAASEPESMLLTIFDQAEGLGKTDACAGRWFAAQLEQFATSWRERLEAKDALEIIINLAQRTAAKI